MFTNEFQNVRKFRCPSGGYIHSAWPNSCMPITEYTNVSKNSKHPTFASAGSVTSSVRNSTRNDFADWIKRTALRSVRKQSFTKQTARRATSS